MNPQIFGPLMDALYAAGALEVFYSAVQMKKNRPGTLMTIVGAARATRALTDIVFRESTTIGVRYQEMSRDCLDREMVTRGDGGRPGALQGGAPQRPGRERATRVRRSGETCGRAEHPNQGDSGVGAEGMAGAMKYFLTTAIDFVNSRPHLGTAYEKITADIIARYRRLAGFDTHFLMGNDEHSQNVFRKAVEQGKDPLAYCDEMEGVFREVWQRLDVSFDDFIRTSDKQAPLSGRAEDGAGLPRQRRHLRRRVRRLLLRRLRGLQAGEGPRRRQLSDPQHQAAVDQGEELVLPPVEVSAAAAEALRSSTPASSSPTSAATRSCGWSKAASKTSR